MHPRGRYRSGWTAQAGCLLWLDMVTKGASPDAPAAECSPLLHAVAERAGCRGCPALGRQLVLGSWHSTGYKRPLWISLWGNQSFQHHPEEGRGLPPTQHLFCRQLGIKTRFCCCRKFAGFPGTTVTDVTPLYMLPQIRQLLPLIQFGWGNNFCIITELYHRVWELSSQRNILVIFSLIDY